MPELADKGSSCAMRDLCGALHIHTVCSDGGVDYPELIRTARGMGLDFAVTTDHMSLEGRTRGFDGLHGRLLVHVGYEHNDPSNLNHYLILDIDRVLPAGMSAREYVERVRAIGGIGFIAHPVEKRHYFKKYPSFPWTEWETRGYDGIELWNQFSEWVENLRSWHSFMRIFFPRRFAKGVSKSLLSVWDDVNRTRFVSGVGGVDAHTMRIGGRRLGFTVFALKVELKGVRTHVFVNDADELFRDAERTRTEILHALRDGHAFISNYRWGDARGTRLFMRYADETEVPPGKQEASSVLPGTLAVELPLSAEIRLVKNGDTVACNTGNSVCFDILEPGLYRIEAFRKGHAWLYSNPFPVGVYPLY